MSAQAAAWVENGTSATIEQVAQGRGDFQPPAGRTIQKLHIGNTLWLHLNLAAQVGAPADWVLKIPMSVIDSVTLYQADAGGAWKGQSAGDTIHMSRWPEPGRYPFFRVTLPPGETRDIYLRIRHSTPVSLPVRLVTVATHDLRSQTEYLALGGVLGAISLLIGMCALRGWRLRDIGYGWYTLYAVLSLLAVAAYTGVAAQLLWTDEVRWIDTSPGVLAMLAASSALMIVRSLSGIVTRRRWLSRMMLGAAVAGPVLAVIYFFVLRTLGVTMLGAYLVSVAILSLWAATVVLRRGDDVGIWMMAGSLPLAFAVMLVLASVFGWIQASWFTEYALVTGIALALPMLLGALHNRSRERRGAEFRQLASSSQDALTGLLTARVFEVRLAQAIARYRQRGEDAAVMLIEIANYAWIRETHGSAMAEQCLLRGVILLRRLVRDVDTTGRVGEARFGLILEGVSQRALVSDRATRLLAAGLRSSPEGGPEIMLQFHVSCALLDEHAKEATSLVFSLGDVLSAMSGRTKHPIRFVDSSEPAPSGPEAAPIMQA